MSATAADAHDGRRATRPLSVVALHAGAHGARFHDANQWSDSVTPHVIRIAKSLTSPSAPCGRQRDDVGKISDVKGVLRRIFVRYLR
jgi:hypothetical protein